MALTIRDAVAADLPALLALMPRLADFDIPPERRAEELWRGDADLLTQHLRGEVSGRFARVGVLEEAIVGLTLVSMKSEPLSGMPSAHLEVFLVARAVEGRGIGRRLLQDAEQGAILRGAKSMTLHVFSRNQRARRVYDAAGYDPELVRYIRRFQT